MGTGCNAKSKVVPLRTINPLNAKLNPICHLLALLGAHRILHVGRIRVKALGTGCNIKDKVVSVRNIKAHGNWM